MKIRRQLKDIKCQLKITGLVLINLAGRINKTKSHNQKRRKEWSSELMGLANNLNLKKVNCFFL